MPTITIPKKLLKSEELVIISRQDYEQFLRVLKNLKNKKYTQLDIGLDKAIKEIRQGKDVGPFYSVKELEESLEK